MSPPSVGRGEGGGAVVLPVLTDGVQGGRQDPGRCCEGKGNIGVCCRRGTLQAFGPHCTARGCWVAVRLRDAPYRAWLVDASHHRDAGRGCGSRLWVARAKLWPRQVLCTCVLCVEIESGRGWFDCVSNAACHTKVGCAYELMHSVQRTRGLQLQPTVLSCHTLPW